MCLERRRLRSPMRHRPSPAMRPLMRPRSRLPMLFLLPLSRRRSRSRSQHRIPTRSQTRRLGRPGIGRRPNLCRRIRLPRSNPARSRCRPRIPRLMGIQPPKRFRSAPCPTIRLLSRPSPLTPRRAARRASMGRRRPPVARRWVPSPRVSTGDRQRASPTPLGRQFPEPGSPRRPRTHRPPRIRAKARQTPRLSGAPMHLQHL